MNTPSRHSPSEQRSHVGPKETGGMAGAIRTPANAKLGIDKPRVFDHEGAIGRQFSGMLDSTDCEILCFARLVAEPSVEHGAVGSIGQSVGGPLAKDGFVGRQFTKEGIVGGSVQSVLGGHKISHS